MEPVSENPSPASLRRIEHADGLRALLDPSWAPRPVALINDRGRLKLLLEDPGGEILEPFLAEPLELTQFLRIAIGLAVALGRMHTRHLIHKDIKPSNVLVNPTTGRGLAHRLWYRFAALPRAPAPEPPEIIAGTLAYMAPEQTGCMNRSIDSRSHLYSLGFSFYEMLVGEGCHSWQVIRWSGFIATSSRLPEAPSLRRSEHPLAAFRRSS